MHKVEQTAQEIFIKAAAEAIVKHPDTEQKGFSHIARLSFMAAEVFWDECLKRDTSKLQPPPQI